MSFYGKVTYYLSNAFNKVVYRNANSASRKPGNIAVNDGYNGPGSVAYEYALSPRSRNDDVILETGNKWIVFGDPEGTASNNQIRIFHQVCDPPYNAGGIVQINIKTPTEEETQGGTQIAKDGDINFGDLITIPAVVFDQAGHISNITTQVLQVATPPGTEDIDTLKNRIARLEQAINGNHGDGGSSGDSIPTEGTPLATEVAEINRLISAWNRATDPIYDANAKYKELDGIGTTLHEVMEYIGLRAARTYTENGEVQQGYIDTTENPSETSLIYRTNIASAQAQSSTIIAIANRRGAREIIDYLNVNGYMDGQTAANLKNTYFDLSGLT